jgi:uncharacterized membrane protein
MFVYGGKFIMRPIKELKRIAREQLNNRYRIPLEIFAISNLIVGLLEVPFLMALDDNPTAMQLIIPSVAEFIIMLLGQVMFAGIIRVHLNMTRGGKIRVRDMFDTFRYGFERYFISALLLSLLEFLALIPFGLGCIALVALDGYSINVLLFVAGFFITVIVVLYVMLSYNFVYFFLSDYSDMGPVAALRESRRMMRHNHFRLLWLLLSFIGYGILVALSVGIASFWVSPYLTESQVIFYLDATGELDHIPVRRY